MREAIDNYGKENARQLVRETVLREGVNRCENELLKMQNYIQDLIPFEITSVELFITTCSNNFRKQIFTEYKAKRKRNDWVKLIRDHYQITGAEYSETLEADDLVAIRARELGQDNYIIATNDKDLKQIGGYYFSYYKQNVLDHEGNKITNELGQSIKEYKQKQMIYMTPQDAQLFFYKQMLMGDTSDNITGIKGIGTKTADKILADVVNPFIAVARAYISKGIKGDFWNTYKLLKLG